MLKSAPRSFAGTKHKGSAQPKKKERKKRENKRSATYTMPKQRARALPRSPYSSFYTTMLSRSTSSSSEPTGMLYTSVNALPMSSHSLSRSLSSFLRFSFSLCPRRARPNTRARGLLPSGDGGEWRRYFNDQVAPCLHEKTGPILEMGVPF